MLSERMVLKVTVLIAVFMLCAMGNAFAAGLTMEQKADDLTVKVIFDVETVPLDKVGMAVAIADAEGKAVTDAKVRVYYGMAAMPGMPPMDYKTKADLDGDVYRSDLEFSMAGPWYVEVKFKRPGDEEITKARFNVDAH